MHCWWPWELWIFGVAVVFLGTLLVLLHIHQLWKQDRLVVKIVEIVVSLGLFVFPQCTNPSFHFHHWFAGWLLGMHANLDTWWSRATMAWCWGQYINGIAVYGRDPTLTCAYGYFVGVDQGCSFLDCYVQSNPETNVTEYRPLLQPDWRNCTV